MDLDQQFTNSATVGIELTGHRRRPLCVELVVADAKGTKHHIGPRYEESENGESDADLHRRSGDVTSNTKQTNNYRKPHIARGSERRPGRSNKAENTTRRKTTWLENTRLSGEDRRPERKCAVASTNRRQIASLESTSPIGERSERRRRTRLAGGRNKRRPRRNNIKRNSKQGQLASTRPNGEGRTRSKETNPYLRQSEHLENSGPANEEIERWPVKKGKATNKNRRQIETLENTEEL